VDGWVCNLADGSVAVAAAAAEPVLEAFVARLRNGPPGAAVRNVRDLARAPVHAGDGFAVLRRVPADAAALFDTRSRRPRAGVDRPRIEAPRRGDATPDARPSDPGDGRGQAHRPGPPAPRRQSSGPGRGTGQPMQRSFNGLAVAHAGAVLPS
jgi:hypothetical protein